MADHVPDFVTGQEFTRWTNEEAAFRLRLETRLAEQSRVIALGFERIDAHFMNLNGRTGSNTSGLTALETRLIRMEKEYSEVMGLVTHVKQDGCAKYAAHAEMLTQLSVSGWTPQKKALVGGGMVATGALVWPALQELFVGIHALIEWASKR